MRSDTATPTGTDSGTGDGDRAGAGRGARRAAEADRDLRQPGAGDRASRRRAARVRARADRPHPAAAWAASGCGRPFLDLRSDVTAGGEQGLLGLAFAPDYARSGRFYVYFTGRDGNQKVQEFRRSARSPNRADEGIAPPGHVDGRPVSEPQRRAPASSGPDDLLYVGTGDGGSGGDPENRAQNLESPARQDPAHRSAPPRLEPRTARPRRTRSWGAPGATRSTPTACATRGASRSTGAPATSTSATSGQNALEEIDYAPRGQARGRNYGWSCFEGAQPLRRLAQLPGRGRPRAAVRARRAASARSRAASCRATRAVPDLAGRYVYGDYCAGRLRSFRIEGGQATDDRCARPARRVAQLVRRGRPRARVRDVAGRPGLPLPLRAASLAKPGRLPAPR